MRGNEKLSFGGGRSKHPDANVAGGGEGSAGLHPRGDGNSKAN